MKAIEKEQILRLNCPGFGEESYLNYGKAKPLNEYTVIAVNPTSILHLFDRDPETIKQVETAQAEGLTSVTIRKDDLLQTLVTVLRSSDGRLVELVTFLEQGGLLIYFLCRPFLVKASSLSMDNYFWLESLAPDTPTDNNVRHMSAISHGRNIELSEEGEGSEFAGYLKQTGLEWSTIIRSDYLTDGYTALATTGPRKCIAGQLSAGDNGGRIVFLPAPYSPDFDRTLVECVDLWNMKRLELTHQTQLDAIYSLGDTVGHPVAETTKDYTAVTAETAQTAASATDQISPEDNSPRQVPGLTASFKSDSVQAPLSKVDTPGRFDPPDRKKFLKGSKSSVATSETTLTESPKEKTKGTGLIVNSDTGKNAPDDFYELEASLTETEELSSFTSSQSDAIYTQKEGELYILDDTNDSRGYSALTAEEISHPLSHELQKAASESSQSSKISEPTDEIDTFFIDVAAKSVAADQMITKESSELAGSSFEISSSESWTKAADSLAQLASLPESPTSPPLQKAEIEAFDSQKKSESEQSSFPELSQSLLGLNSQSDNNKHDEEPGNKTIPHAKDLIIKMEGISKTVAPDWCPDYSFPGLDELKEERSSLTEQIHQTQAKISILETRIAVLDGIKNSLLTEDGDDLLNACQKVFKQLNWNSEKSPNSKEELWLGDGKQAEVIVRVLRTNSQPKNTDLAKLAQSIITYWGEHETEPKGLMIASTWANLPPSERREPDYGEALKEFAKKKNLCLMTTMQLLCIYRDVDLGQTTADEVRKKLMNTNGLLSGLALEKAISGASAS